MQHPIYTSGIFICVLILLSCNELPDIQNDTVIITFGSML